MNIEKAYKSIENSKAKRFVLCGGYKYTKALLSVFEINHSSEVGDISAESLICDYLKHNAGVVFGVYVAMCNTFKYVFIKDVEELFSKPACLVVVDEFINNLPEKTKVIFVTDSYNNGFEQLGVDENDVLSIDRHDCCHYFVTHGDAEGGVEICSDSNNAVLAFISENNCITDEEYKKYFVPLKAGDDFVLCKKFKEASYSYNQALAYSKKTGNETMQVIATFRLAACSFFDKAKNPKELVKCYKLLADLEQQGKEFNIHKYYLKMLHLRFLDFVGYSLMLAEESI